MPSQRVLFTSDLHSRRELYAQLVEWTERLRPDIVLLGGDLFGGDPRAQVAFARGPCIDALERMRASGAGVIGLLPGNDDWSAALAALRDCADPAWLHALAAAPLELAGGVNVVGYAYVPLTPYSVKDHEKLDHFRPDKMAVLEGIASGVGSRADGVAGMTRPVDGSESIAADLVALERLVRPGRTLFVSHCPPRNTRLDVAYGRHAGSQAVCDFLLRARPALSLHGHIDAVAAGGVFAEWVGDTLAVNPGQGDRLHAVHFEAQSPVATLVHTTLGNWRDAPESALGRRPDAGDSAADPT